MYIGLWFWIYFYKSCMDSLIISYQNLGTYHQGHAQYAAQSQPFFDFAASSSLWSNSTRKKKTGFRPCSPSSERNSRNYIWLAAYLTKVWKSTRLPETVIWSIFVQRHIQASTIGWESDVRIRLLVPLLTMHVMVPIFRPWPVWSGVLHWGKKFAWKILFHLQFWYLSLL